MAGRTAPSSKTTFPPTYMMSDDYNDNGSTIAFASQRVEQRQQRVMDFPQFVELGDDIMHHVVSFVADAPFETGDMCPTGTLTHTLPLVCRRFHQMCRESDTLWAEALERRLEEEPQLWQPGLVALAQLDATGGEDASGSSNTGDVISGSNGAPVAESFHRGGSGGGGDYWSQRRDRMELIRRACNALRAEFDELDWPELERNVPPPSLSYLCAAQLVFRHIAGSHLRYTSPVFYMPAQISLGIQFGLHFFEGRYRLLISEVMRNHPPSDLDGRLLPPSHSINRPSVEAAENDSPPCGVGCAAYPQFIYANHAPLQPGSPAVIAEVRRCRMYENGTADVMLLPVSHVWIETLAVRPDSGGLFEARVIRMGRESSGAMEASVLGNSYDRRSGDDGGGTGGGVDAENAVHGTGRIPASVHDILMFLANRGRT